MPGYDRTIDPMTGDYVDAAGGAFEETLTLASAVYHQVKGELDHWVGDPSAGSNLFKAKHLGSGRVGQRASEDAALVALKRFVTSGEATDLSATAVGLARGLVVLAVELTDVQSGQVDLTVPLGEG